MTNQRNRSSAESGFEPKFSFLSRLAKFETGPGDAEAESDPAAKPGQGFNERFGPKKRKNRFRFEAKKSKPRAT